MNDDFDLIADIREDQGRGASRRLRHEGKVPAIIYGAGRPPRALLFDHNRVLQPVSYTHLRAHETILPSAYAVFWL